MAAVGEILGGDPRFVAALGARGFKIDGVLGAPWTLGNNGMPAYQGRRLLKSACFVIGAGGSPFNRPIEGLWAVVDLNSREVIEIHDEAVIPVSTAPAAVDAASVASRRAPLRPLVVHRPEGSNVTSRSTICCSQAYGRTSGSRGFWPRSGRGGKTADVARRCFRLD